MRSRRNRKQAIKRIFSKNPLWYIGWLGFLGVLGVFCVPTLIPFLLFFTFFVYGKTEPDELFWKHVRCASTRAFWTVFFTDVAGMLGIIFRAMFLAPESHIQPVLENNIVTTPAFSVEQMSLMVCLLILNQTLMVVVFSVSMLKYRKQEKRMLEE